MKPLEKTIRKGIFTYHQLARTENYAIYEHRISENQTIVSHEVFRIQKYKEREISGNVILAHEAMCGDSQFGVCAWSIRDYNRAMDRLATVGGFPDAVQPTPERKTKG